MTNKGESIEWQISTSQDAIKFLGQMMVDITAGRIKPSLAKKVLADFNRRLKEAGGRFRAMERTAHSMDRLNKFEREHQQVMEKGGGKK